jgi:hypothetical protein
MMVETTDLCSQDTPVALLEAQPGSVPAAVWRHAQESSEYFALQSCSATPTAF